MSGPLRASARVAALDWNRIRGELDAQGWSTLPKLLERDECSALAALYGDERRFRKRVVMAQHGFGRGEYQYFAYPLPHLVAALRAALYPHLASIANHWSEALSRPVRYPARLAEYIERCRRAGQSQPTPLLLRYGEGDFNRLHQDLYGEQVFPLQLTVLLSEPERDFSGGEFLITEQRPRMQSRADVVPLRRGDGVVFAVHERPVHGTRGVHRATMRHGVSRLRSGQRTTLGIIFHDGA